MFEELEKINAKPGVFELYTAEALWADDHRSRQMLRLHLDGNIDVSSRSTHFVERSSTWMIDRFDLGPGKAVCDFGCGPGLYTSRLASSGARVTGIDFSPRSIRYAREQAEHTEQTISYVHGNYLTFSTNERFDLITMIMCDFCALSPAQRRKLMAIWHGCLKDGGAILLDVYSIAAYAERDEAQSCEKNQLDHFWHADDYYAFVNTFKYDDDAVVLDQYTIFPERGPSETVYNWLQYFSVQSLTEELADAGFQVDAVYRNVAGEAFLEDHSEFAVVARKNR